MKIKKDDTVKVLAGKDKGKTGKVLQVLPDLERASVAGANISYKHLRSQRRGQAGQKIEFPAPIHLSNLGLVCPHCGRATRVGFKKSEDGKTKTRMCKKCQGTI